MKKFHFPLRTVAILRRYRQEQAREVFAAAVQAFVLTEDQLTRMRTIRLELETTMEDARRTRLKASDEIAFRDSYRQAAEQETKAERAVADARTAMEKKRQEYLEAHRGVKIVEKLEQKARTNYRHEVDREAQRDLDEIAGSRVARRRSNATVISS